MKLTVRALIAAAGFALTGATVAADKLQADATAYDEQRIAELDAAIDAGTYKDINSVIVMRNGELLVERYYNGARRDQTHNPRSVGKTFAATILGIAMNEGYINSVDQHLGEFYDLKEYENFSAKKTQVSLRQLLTMTSGFEGYDFDMDSIGNEEYMYPQDNWVQWTLDLPMATDRSPGDAWRYFTAGVVVLGDILHEAVPDGLESYAHKKLFTPLGVTDYQWQHTPQGVANTAGGVQLTPLGFAKFGQLHKNRGNWEGQQLIPADWVDAMLSPTVETTVPGNRYGYLWWHKTYVTDDAEWPVAYCSGNGGNKIFVFDDRDLVIVVTASAYGQPYMHSQVDDMMQRYILPAVGG